MMGIFLPDFQGYEPWCGTHLSFLGSIIVAALRPLMTFQPLNINKLPGERADARKHGADGDLLKDTWRCILAQVTICI